MEIIENMKQKENKMKKSLSVCPTCGKHLKISQYHCPRCEIDINGEFEGCMFCNLSDEDRYFALVFLQTGGNIKDVERVMGISYPTVKAKLHQLLANLGVGNGCCGDERKKVFDKRALKEELKSMKKKLKMKIKHDIHKSFHRQFGPAKVHLDVNTKTSGHKERAETRDVLDQLKNGNIDVATALKRLKGEGDGPKDGCCPDEVVEGSCDEANAAAGCCDDIPGVECGDGKEIEVRIEKIEGDENGRE
jgi:hypothetical protein